MLLESNQIIVRPGRSYDLSKKIAKCVLYSFFSSFQVRFIVEIDQEDFPLNFHLVPALNALKCYICNENEQAACGDAGGIEKFLKDCPAIEDPHCRKIVQSGKMKIFFLKNSTSFQIDFSRWKNNDRSNVWIKNWLEIVL